MEKGRGPLALSRMPREPADIAEMFSFMLFFIESLSDVVCAAIGNVRMTRGRKRLAVTKLHLYQAIVKTFGEHAFMIKRRMNYLK